MEEVEITRLPTVCVDLQPGKKGWLQTVAPLIVPLMAVVAFCLAVWEFRATVDEQRYQRTQAEAEAVSTLIHEALLASEKMELHAKARAGGPATPETESLELAFMLQVQRIYFVTRARTGMGEASPWLPTLNWLICHRPTGFERQWQSKLSDRLMAPEFLEAASRVLSEKIVEARWDGDEDKNQRMKVPGPWRFGGWGDAGRTAPGGK